MVGSDLLLCLLLALRKGLGVSSIQWKMRGWWRWWGSPNGWLWPLALSPASTQKRSGSINCPMEDKKMAKMMRKTKWLALNSCTQKRAWSINYLIEDEKMVKMMRKTKRLALNSSSVSCCQSENGWEYQVSHGRWEDGEDDEDDEKVGSELMLCLLLVQKLNFQYLRKILLRCHINSHIGHEKAPTVKNNFLF